MRIRSSLFPAVALVLLCCTPISGQTVTGTLYDRTGAVISGARVMLMSEDYVKLAESKSGDRGEFSFTGIKPGLYFVQAKKPMFHLAQQHVFLEAGRSARVHLMADVARGDEELSITGERIPGVGAPPGGAPTVRAGGKVEGFKRLSGRPPGFPESARKRGVSGAVVLFATIKLDGTLAGIVTLESPDQELEKISLDAFSQWRYEPMKLDGVAVESNTVAVFDFQYQ